MAAQSAALPAPTIRTSYVVFIYHLLPVVKSRCEPTVTTTIVPP
jgi:hypothetical protein